MSDSGDAGPRRPGDADSRGPEGGHPDETGAGALPTRREKADRIRRIMTEEGPAIETNTTTLNQRRQLARSEFPETDAVGERARAIKEDAIERLPELIEEVRTAVEANGGHVYLADDAADANAYVREVADDADSVVKSKSMTTEEIDLNEALEAAGADVWETDLGEFVIQVAEEAPSHIVGPAMHKSRESIAALFREAFDPDGPLETAEDLTRFARDYLGERIRAADVGITGANFVLADSGTVVLVTNEGNARKCAVTPDTHVAVAGVEKLIPSVAELEPFAQLIARAATGQPISQYLSLLSPPTDSPTLDFDDDAPLSAAADDREFHLVLLDNGRTAMREDDQLRETLYCIRCGACANSCGNFQQVGGHAFGGETYSGGIAGGWEAGVHGLDAAGEFNDLCTGCSRCVDACPVDIDVPWINTVVRDRLNRDADGRFDHLVAGLTPDEEPGGLDVRKRLFGNLGTVAKVAGATAPVSNWLARSGVGKWALARLGVDPRRDLPEFRRETLRDWYEARGSRVGDPARKVVLYPDLYTNRVAVERGKAAVRLLEALRPHLGAGRRVVVVEPSDLAMFRDDYGKLLPADEHEPLADAAHELFEYVYGLLENGADAGALPAGDGERVVYHAHCQQRTLGLGEYTVAVLEDLGYDVTTTNAECCGMAGSFGYKSEYYELSMAVGESLAGELDSRSDRTVVASGTSCLDQLDDLLERPSTHPAELLDPRSAR